MGVRWAGGRVDDGRRGGGYKDRMMLWRISRVVVVALVVACGGDDDGDDGGSEAATGESGGEPTGGDAMAAEVCAAACKTFAGCVGENPSCESDCVAGIEFMAMNNPGTQCGSFELGRQECLAGLSCEELDRYVQMPNDPERPCKSWVDLEQDCAIE